MSIGTGMAALVPPKLLATCTVMESKGAAARSGGGW